MGFLAASGLWAALAAVLYASGVVALAREHEPEPTAVAAEAPDSDEVDPKQRKRSKRGSPNGKGPRDRGAPLPRGEATTGDDLDWNGQRQVDMAGGEEQLSGTEIEAGFDGVMNRIRRCLVLVPAEAEVTGKLTFGMRVGGDGVPRAVNLSGPAVVTSGESGTCLRQAAQSIRFAKFQGPDMLFRYPITLR